MGRGSLGLSFTPCNRRVWTYPGYAAAQEGWARQVLPPGTPLPLSRRGRSPRGTRYLGTVGGEVSLGPNTEVRDGLRFLEESEQEDPREGVVILGVQAGSVLLRGPWHPGQ